MFTSQKVDLSHWKLRAIRLSTKQADPLKALLQLQVGQADESLAEPTFARVGEQRWLAYHVGDRRDGRIVIVPVNGQLAAIGRPYIATADTDAVYESHLFGLDQQRLLIVYIARPNKGATELVSEVLNCSVL